MQFQLSFIGIAAILATPAAIQQTAPGSVPIYDITPPVLPTPTPTPAPTAASTPRATPTPRAAATPRPAPATPRAVPTPTVRATPVATPTPRAVATPAPISTPTEAAIAPPVATSTPEVEPTPEALPAPEPSPAIVVSDSAPATGGDALPWWVWFLGGVAVAGLAAVAIGRFRRGRAQAVYADVPVAPVPVAPVPATPIPAVPPIAPSAPRPAPPVRPAPPATPETPPAPVEPAGPFLEFQLTPLRVGLQGDNALLDFDLTIGNPASMPVAEVSIATLLLTANAAQDEQIAAFFANDAKRGLDPFALGAGERRDLEATMTLPRAAVNVVTVNDRTFFVPFIAIDARYRWEDGRESRTTAAFLVGPSAPNGKLAPIFTDRGDRMAERLEVRLHGPVRRT